MDFTTATVNAQTFVYSDSGGDGPLVAMFHGFPDLPFGWSDARDALVGAGYRVVVPYLRGYHPDTIVPGTSVRGEGDRRGRDPVTRRDRGRAGCTDWPRLGRLRGLPCGSTCA